MITSIEDKRISQLVEKVYNKFLQHYYRKELDEDLYYRDFDVYVHFEPDMYRDGSNIECEVCIFPKSYDK